VPERPVSAAAPVVPATPATVDFRFPEPAEPAAPAVVRDEPRAVRVHIGRLEVRANLQEAPQQPQRGTRQAPPEGLSLSDYLRGRREAG